MTDGAHAEGPNRWATFAFAAVVVAAPAAVWLVPSAAGLHREAEVVLVLAVALLVAWSLWSLSERLWPALGRRRSLAALVLGLLLAGVAVVPAIFYEYALSIKAGLCGPGGGWWLGVIPALTYAVVSSWGMRSPTRLLWAWPLAVLAAAAMMTLVAYVDPASHGFCET